ncbi:MAG: site-specific integrase [Prevotellaceae bacterium]|nr:site-specific integrase [Prevotellaceae bacterium]
MITFKAIVRPERKMKDGSYRVFIRCTYKRQTFYIKTSMTATRSDLTYTYAIKNEQIQQRCALLIAEYRKRVYDADLELREASLREVEELLLRKEREDNEEMGSGEDGISFTAYAVKWLDAARIKGVKNYRTAVKAFHAFMGKDDVSFAEVNHNTLREFARSLEDRPRAYSAYSMAITRIFNDARDEMNDEDEGVMVIRHTLRKFKVPRQGYETEKRALDVETLRRLFALGYDGATRGRWTVSRRDLALDCFRLSFCLMGMNAADMYGAPQFKGDTIVYNRQKTRDRRADHARMEVRVDRRVAALVDKWRGKDRAFRFSEMFADEAAFGRSVNMGLKQVAAELGLERLTFYAARHTMATLAVNDAGIDKWTVNDMLCHTDASMRITDIYIKKDFRRVNEAMGILLDYALGDESVKC